MAMQAEAAMIERIFILILDSDFQVFVVLV